MSRGEREQLGALLSLLKRRATGDAPDRPFSASQYLLFSAETSSHPFISSLASQPHSPSGCRDGHSYEPGMGSQASQGPDVHRASQLARSSPRALESEHILRDIP